MEAVQELSLREENTAFSRLLEVMRSGYLQESLLKSTAERLQLVNSRGLARVITVHV